MGLMMSAAGPFHAAGNHAVAGFRRKGLLNGAKEGVMLGSEFFEDSNTKYKILMMCDAKPRSLSPRMLVTNSGQQSLLQCVMTAP